MSHIAEEWLPREFDQSTTAAFLLVMDGQHFYTDTQGLHITDKGTELVEEEEEGHHHLEGLGG